VDYNDPGSGGVLYAFTIDPYVRGQVHEFACMRRRVLIQKIYLSSTLSAMHKRGRVYL
jgi:hypothetical protein